MRFLQAALTIFVVMAIAAVAFAYSGIFNVAATEQHDPVSNWLMQTTRSKSIEARSGSVQLPDLSDEKRRLAGINEFAKMCA